MRSITSLDLRAVNPRSHCSSVTTPLSRRKSRSGPFTPLKSEKYFSEIEKWILVCSEMKIISLFRCVLSLQSFRLSQRILFAKRKGIELKFCKLTGCINVHLSGLLEIIVNLNDPTSLPLYHVRIFPLEAVDIQVLLHVLLQKPVFRSVFLRPLILEQLVGGKFSRNFFAVFGSASRE